MNSPGVNIELQDEMINEELDKEDVIQTGHPLLTGGGGVAVLAGVVTLILAPQLPDDVWSFLYIILISSFLLPVSVTNISINTGVVIDVPGPEELMGH